MNPRKLKVFVHHLGEKDTSVRLESCGLKKRIKPDEIFLMAYEKAAGLAGKKNFKLLQPEEISIEVFEKLSGKEVKAPKKTKPRAKLKD